jgi:hypothetical protein
LAISNSRMDPPPPQLGHPLKPWLTNISLTTLPRVPPLPCPLPL